MKKAIYIYLYILTVTSTHAEHKKHQQKNGIHTKNTNRKRGICTCPKASEESDVDLQHDDGPQHKVDGRAVDVLVDLGGVVGKENVVAVHQVLHTQVHQTYDTKHKSAIASDNQSAQHGATTTENKWSCG